MEKIGGNLLNFEESINAEMEAELLTGKQLNLEKARQAAIDGNLGVLAEEISKNIGDSADFAALNVIQQEAIARAVGMTREELASSLRSQEQLAAVSEALGGDFQNINEAQAEYNRLAKEGELTDIQRQKLAEVGLAQQMESASIEEMKEDTQKLLMEDIQDKLIPSMTDMRDIAVDIQGFFMRMMDTVMKIYEAIANALKPVIDLVKNTLDRIGDKLSEAFGTSEGIGGAFEVISSILSFIGGVLTDVIAYQLDLFVGFVDLIITRVQAVLQIFSDIGS